MNSTYRKLSLLAIRLLSRSRWGRRLIRSFKFRALRTQLRRFLRDMAELFPVLETAAAWV